MLPIWILGALLLRKKGGWKAKITGEGRGKWERKRIRRDKKKKREEEGKQKKR